MVQKSTVSNFNDNIVTEMSKPFAYIIDIENKL
jgi:hypothetical protein